MKLKAFHLETYREREALLWALTKVRPECPDWHRQALTALLERLSRTQCQPGGCEHCQEPPETYVQEPPETCVGCDQTEEHCDCARFDSERN